MNVVLAKLNVLIILTITNAATMMKIVVWNGLPRFIAARKISVRMGNVLKQLVVCVQLG